VLLKADAAPDSPRWTDEDIRTVLGSGLTGQCLRRRIPDRAILEHETGAWERDRNARVRTIDWRFTTADASIKLKRLYPSL
jgi:hypothetical protein